MMLSKLETTPFASAHIMHRNSDIPLLLTVSGFRRWTLGAIADVPLPNATKPGNYYFRKDIPNSFTLMLHFRVEHQWGWHEPNTLHIDARLYTTDFELPSDWVAQSSASTVLWMVWRESCPNITMLEDAMDNAMQMTSRAMEYADERQQGVLP